MRKGKTYEQLNQTVDTNPQNTLTKEDILNYALNNGMLDLALIQAQEQLRKRKEILNNHPYEIYQGKDQKWYTYLPDKTKGRLKKKRNSKEEIEALVIDFWSEKLTDPTVADVFTEWVERKLEVGDISKATYDRYLIDFNRFFTEFGKKKIKDVTPADISDFAKHSVKKFELTNKAYSNLRTLLFGIFKRAFTNGYITFSITNVINDIEFSRKAFARNVKEDWKEVFMEDELPLFIEYLVSHQDILNLGLLLMVVTGLRVGELVAIELSDIENNVIYVNKMETRYKDPVSGKTVFEVVNDTKSDVGTREVIIPDDYLWVIKKMRILNPWGPYLLMKDGVRVKTYTLRKRQKFVCDKTGIYPKSPHKSRKTYGTILLDNQVPTAMILQQMGHTEILTTEKHYHRNRKRTEAKSRIISTIPDLAAQ